MPSVKENILNALMVAMQGALSAEVSRNELTANRIPDLGRVVIHDGEVQDPERVLGGFNDVYVRHIVEVEVMVRHKAATGRDEAFDNLCMAIEDVLQGDETLGGLCHGMEWAQPEIDNEHIPGGEDIKAGVIPLAVEYSAPSALS